MASTIDASKPIAVNPTTKSVRDQFAAAIVDIEALQALSLPVADTVSIVKGSADATKLARFEADGITTGTTRVMTIPDANFVIVGDTTAQTLTNKTLTSPVLDLSTITSAGDLAVADGGTGASTLTDGGVLLGSGTGAVTATAVLADGEMIVGDGTTDPAIESGATLRASIGVAIGSDVQAFDADTLKADVDDTLTGGFGGTDDADGTKTTGTYTPTYAGGNFKTATNGGAHTLAPQSGTGTIIVQYTNDGSAGAITTSGFTIVTGDAFSTTNGDDFMCYLTVVSTFSQLHIVALQ